MNIATLLLSLLPGLLGSIPGISAAIKQVITDISGAAAVVLASGAVSSPNANTILAAWLGVITVLEADPGLPQNTLNAILQLEKSIQAALLNDVTASQQVDWSKIVTIATV